METAYAEPIIPSRVLRQLGSHASEEKTIATVAYFTPPYHYIYINTIKSGYQDHMVV